MYLQNYKENTNLIQLKCLNQIVAKYFLFTFFFKEKKNLFGARSFKG